MQDLFSMFTLTPKTDNSFACLSEFIEYAQQLGRINLNKINEATMNF